MSLVCKKLYIYIYAMLTRHAERSSFENYCNESGKSEIFRESILKMKQEKLDMMKSFLNK